MLELISVVTGYHEHKVLSDVSLNAAKGRIIALIGHNGAGKSTLLKLILGILPLWSGKVLLDGQDVSHTALPERLALGMGYVPQGNRIFGELTVKDNILIGGRPGRHLRQANDPVQVACDRFPQLRSLLRKRAGLLSGGEKQVLSMSMTLVRSPNLLLLDEPSLGLSCEAVSAAFAEILRLRDDDGLTIIVAEQKVAQVLAVSDQVCALRTGSIVFDGRPNEIESPEEMRRIFL